jgi:DNA-binding IclR family transcriptional regulator
MANLVSWHRRQKQTDAVLEAVRSGAETSAMVAAVIGTNTATASAVLSELEDIGLVRVTHRKGQRGIAFNRYVVKD